MLNHDRSYLYRCCRIVPIILCCGSVGLMAQSAVRPQFETAQQTQDDARVPTASTRGSAVMLNDHNTGSDDLGEQWIFRSSEKHTAFTASAEVSAFHTSNVALSSRDEEEDAYLVGQLSVGWQKLLSNGLLVDVSIQDAFFRYGDFSELNFDSINLGAGVAKTLPQLADIQVFGRYNFNRISSENFGAELYDSHSLTLGAQKGWQLSRADLVFAGISAQVNFSDPKDLERHEASLYAGYHLELTRSVSTDVVYRGAFYDYSRGDRQDVNQNLSVSLRWKPVENLSVSATATGTVNRSNHATYDYNLLTTGVSLSLSYQF